MTRWPEKWYEMTRTKKWDVSSRTRCPGTRWRSRSWTSGHLLLPHELPTLSIYLTYYSSVLNTFRFQRFAYWPVDNKSLPKEWNCILRLARKFSEALQLLYSTRSSSQTRCRINACVRTSTFGSRNYQLVINGGLDAIGTDRYHILQRVGGHWSPLIQIATDVGSCWEKSEFRL